MSKRIISGEDARKQVLAGAKTVYDVVSATLGPKGNNVLLARQGLPPIITHDGITSIKSITIPDVDDETLGQSVGAELVKSASATMDKVGDGSTTVSILAYHIMNEANKLMAAGYNSMQLRKQIEATADVAIKALDSRSEDIGDKSKQVAQIATISAGDAEIGQLIADIVAKIGSEGTVAVEAGQGLKLESEITKGYTFGRGYASPYMVTNQSSMEAIYKNVPILVTDAKLTASQDLIPLLESLSKAGKRDLVIMADDVTGDALGFLVVNKLKGTFNAVVVKAPSYGDRRQQTLEDIATITGAQFISTERGSVLKDTAMTDLGAAKQVIVTANDTTIIDGEGAQEDVISRSGQLDALVEKTKSEFDREFYERRRASLHGKVAVIRVGGATETEIEEKKFRVEDAVNAAKAAVRGGIVAGGEVTLVNVGQSFKADFVAKNEPGAGIVLRALEMPFRVLLENSGRNPDEYLKEVRARFGYGLDVSSDKNELVDLKKLGIVDPVEVTKEAVKNAVSIAATAMTLGSIVIELPEKEVSAQPQMPMV
jgi:chaperonin GroEL